MLRRLKLLVILLTLSLVLAGCNRVGLAYRNLDVIIPWTLNDYRAQTSALQQSPGPTTAPETPACDKHPPHSLPPPAVSHSRRLLKC